MKSMLNDFPRRTVLSLSIFGIGCLMATQANSAAPAPPVITLIDGQPVSAPSTGTLNLPREPWWGGPAYYAKFPKAAASGWTSPTFYPISVFFGKPAHASRLAAAGINTYHGAEHDGSAISTITTLGISVFAQSEWTRAEVGDNPRVVGWHISDECEQGEGPCWLNGDEYARLKLQTSWVNTVRAQNDGRMVQANFGNGVLGSWWAPNTMANHVTLMDTVSVDKYAYTSPGVRYEIGRSPSWPSGKNPESAFAYGWLQDRMESYMSPASSKPNWVFVETARPFLNESGATTITTDRISGAVWNAIINGAAGISYFQHNNNGSCGTYSILDCGADRTAAITAINAKVTSLAPVINTQGYVWSFGAGLDTALKVYNGYAYIFAMTDGGTGSRTFTLPAGLTGSVEVVGENRTVSTTNGTFTDAFAAEHTHHIYKIRLQ